MKIGNSVLFMFIGGLVVTGCAGAPKLAPDQRQVQFVVETPGVTKADAYTRSKTWFAKSFNNSNAVIRSDDQANGKIIGKGNVICNALRQWGDVNDYTLEFTVETLSKDGKTRLSFEDLNVVRPGSAFVNNIDSTSDLEKVKKECLTSVADGFKAAMSGGSKKSDDF